MISLVERELILVDWWLDASLFADWNYAFLVAGHDSVV
jgi:hypothetical protein